MPGLMQIGISYATAGAFVFGSGLAIVPFLYGGVVTEHHWLNDKQFVDAVAVAVAVAVAMITPDPVVNTGGFVGYLIGGFSGAATAALATFIPCYLLTVVPAPYFKKYSWLRGVLAFVDGITAAAIGAISGSVNRDCALIDQRPSLWRFKKLPEPFVVLVAALAGLVMNPLLHTG